MRKYSLISNIVSGGEKENERKKNWDKNIRNLTIKNTKKQ